MTVSRGGSGLSMTAKGGDASARLHGGCLAAGLEAPLPLRRNSQTSLTDHLRTADHLTRRSSRLAAADPPTKPTGRIPCNRKENETPLNQADPMLARRHSGRPMLGLGAPARTAAPSLRLAPESATLKESCSRSKIGGGASPAKNAAVTQTRSRISGRMSNALGDITNVVHSNFVPNKSLSSQPCKETKPVVGKRPLTIEKAEKCLRGEAQQASRLEVLKETTPRKSSVFVRADTPTPTTATTEASTATPSEERPEFNAPFAGDACDAQKASEYQADVHGGLFDYGSFPPMPKSEYMDRQEDLNPKMRAILVDWLIEVHDMHQLRLETLFLAVNILDRYLSIAPVRRKQLQLIGVTAMFVAAKFEEIRPPTAKEFAFITDNSYSKAEILSMEITMVRALDCDLVVPNPADFLYRLERANGSDWEERYFVRYCLELSLVPVHMIDYPVHVLVASALLLSNEVRGQTPLWPAIMAHHSRMAEADLRQCVKEMRSLAENASSKNQPQGVYKKYSSSRLGSVAHLLCKKPDLA